jgi:hypothetical protein
MQVMFNVTSPLQREQIMTKGEDRSKVVAIKELPERDDDFVRTAVQSFVQAALEAEMTEALRSRDLLLAGSAVSSKIEGSAAG